MVPRRARILSIALMGCFAHRAPAEASHTLTAMVESEMSAWPSHHLKVSPGSYGSLHISAHFESTKAGPGPYGLMVYFADHCDAQDDGGIGLHTMYTGAGGPMVSYTFCASSYHVLVEVVFPTDPGDPAVFNNLEKLAMRLKVRLKAGK